MKKLQKLYYRLLYEILAELEYRSHDWVLILKENLKKVKAKMENMNEQR